MSSQDKLAQDFNDKSIPLYELYTRGVTEGKLLPCIHQLMPVLIDFSLEKDEAYLIGVQEKDGIRAYGRAKMSYSKLVQIITTYLARYNALEQSMREVPEENLARLTEEDHHNILRMRKSASDSIDAFAKVTGVHLDDGFTLDMYQSEDMNEAFRQEMVHANSKRGAKENALDTLSDNRTQDVDKCGGQPGRPLDLRAFDVTRMLAHQTIRAQISSFALRN